MLTITQFLIPGAYGAASALAITVADSFRSQNAEETKSSFLTDLAKNLTLGVFVPVATFGLIKGAVYLGIIPVASKLLTSFLALSIILKIAIPVLTIAAILSVIAISVLIYKRMKVEEVVESNEVISASVNLNASGTSEVTTQKIEEEKHIGTDLSSGEEDDVSGGGTTATEVNTTPVANFDMTASTLVREQDALDNLLDATLDSIK